MSAGAGADTDLSPTEPILLEGADGTFEIRCENVAQWAFKERSFSSTRLGETAFMILLDEPTRHAFTRFTANMVGRKVSVSFDSELLVELTFVMKISGGQIDIGSKNQSLLREVANEFENCRPRGEAL